MFAQIMICLFLYIIKTWFIYVIYDKIDFVYEIKGDGFNENR